MIIIAFFKNILYITKNIAEQFHNDCNLYTIYSCTYLTSDYFSLGFLAVLSILLWFSNWVIIFWQQFFITTTFTTYYYYSWETCLHIWLKLRNFLKTCVHSVHFSLFLSLFLIITFLYGCAQFASFYTLGMCLEKIIYFPAGLGFRCCYETHTCAVLFVEKSEGMLMTQTNM